MPEIGVARDKAKVVTAMSGGVDSSVAAALLKKQGYEVCGVTMKTWGGEAFADETKRHGCYGPEEEQDIADAQRVAQTLGIDFHILDLRQEYEAEVLDYFRHEYLSGRTPNPCFRCNARIKFDALVRKAQDSGIEFDYFATGHYARIEYDENKHRYLLKRARDLSKDQSYFLASLSQEQLGGTLFPLGSYTKAEVRKMASEFGLAVANKRESQDFVAGDYLSLLELTPPGPILDKWGNVLGEHRGIPLYTIGQRKRLGISAKEPLYVIDIDLARNAIIVGSQAEVLGDELTASQLNWIAIDKLETTTEVKTKIRHSHKATEATITPRDEDKAQVKFKEPQMAITPGQVVVFYQGDIVIGGGIIEKIGSE